MAHYKGASKEASRAMNLMKKRQKEQEELEMRKRKIEDELKIGTISNKFAAHYDAVETKLKSGTVGMFWMLVVSIYIVFGRPFVKRFAICYRTVVLSCPVCL